MGKYEEYMRSRHWIERKKIYFSKKKKQCRSCFTTVNIHLHHLSYDNLGNEPNIDLLALCETCHSLAHKYIALKNLPLREGTFAFINEVKISQPIIRKDNPQQQHIPVRQRMTREQRTAEMTGGKKNNLRGLPIVMI